MDGDAFARQPWRDDGWIALSAVILDLYRRWTGRDLIEAGGGARERARRLFEASIVVVAHGTERDPILCYGNRAALDLWELDLPALLRMPSRQTAEPAHREERARLLQRTGESGYVDDYRGVRISATGRRFLIEQATVWNLLDHAGERLGQAAAFDRWRRLDG